jgi:hypothetical protein
MTAAAGISRRGDTELIEAIRDAFRPRSFERHALLGQRRMALQAFRRLLGFKPQQLSEQPGSHSAGVE